MKLKIEKQTKGITLIALVITIIVLLILAGVSIAMLIGPNGLITKAQEAKEKTEIAGEKEYLEQNVLTIQLGEYTGDVSSKKLGAELNPRNAYHTSDWHIVKVNGKSYGNEGNGGGWHFVQKGTNLPGYGTAQHSYLVNYETSEIIELEEGNYTDLSAGDMLAVKDDIIINIDTSIVDKDIPQTQDNLQAQFGKGVELHNFDFSNNDHSKSGLTNESFNFDGEDDYITIKFDNKEDKQKLADRGFTFEFYGNIEGTSDDTTGFFAILKRI